MKWENLEMDFGLEEETVISESKYKHAQDWMEELVHCIFTDDKSMERLQESLEEVCHALDVFCPTISMMIERKKND